MRHLVTSSVVALGAGLVAGLLAHPDGPPSTGLELAWLGFALAALAFARRPPVSTGAIVCAVALAGLALGAEARSARGVAPSLPVGERELVLEVRHARPVSRGLVVEADLLAHAPARWVSPERGTSDPEAPGPDAALPRTAPGVWQSTSAPTRVRFTFESPTWHPVCGDVLHVRGELIPPRRALHSYAFDPEAYYRSRGLAAGVRLDGTPALASPSEPGPPAAALATALDRHRVRMERSLSTRASPETVGVLLAVTTGSRGLLEDATRRRYAANGAAHVLAVSGLHLGLLCAAVYGLARRAVRLATLLTRRVPADAIAAALTAPLVVAYVAMTGWPASAVRAGVMALVVLGGVVASRPASSIRALAAAVFGMLVVRPQWCTEVGFQLSVAATASLVGTAALAASRGSAPACPAWRRVARAVLVSLRVSTVASLATAPVLLWHFGRVPLLSPLTNLIAVPPIALVALPSAVIGANLDALGLPGAGLAIGVADLAVRASAWVADSGSAVLEAQLTWGRPRPVALVGWTLLATASPWLGIARPRAHAVVAAASAVLVAAAPPTAWRTGELRMHAIPVGQGDCTLLILPDGTRALVDGGGDPASPSDTAWTAVLPYLHGIGVGRVDVVIASHADFDHAGGLPALVAELRPAEVWLPPRDARPVVLRIRAAASAVGARVRTITWPLARVREDTRLVAWSAAPGMGHNDAGIVIRVCYHRVCFLLPGDIEAERERALLLSGAPLGATVLKVPHHGSRTSSTEAFIDAVLPALAVLHVGERNRFGFPKPDVVRRYTDRGILVRRTDDGELVVTTDGAAIAMSR